MASETVFTYGAPNLKFGAGASGEIGYDLSTCGVPVSRVLVVTDPRVAETGHPRRIAEQMKEFGIDADVYAGAHVEPTDESLEEAAAWAREHGPYDAFVGVGGGSAMDTAKAVDLLTTNDGEVRDYLNAPIGEARTPEQPLKPLVAVPTTTGTGSESTTVCVLDVLSLQVKTGISHPRLRPMLAVVDPLLALSQPPGVTAASGMDILCHALESYTARPYTSFDRKQPEQRVPYCGANPVSDMWAQEALRLLSDSFRRAVRDGSDEAARGKMALAATYAGMGIGNAGVHIPHANAYPVAGRVRDFRPADYPDEEPMVPHGMAVGLTAPEVFRFTYEADPARHLHAADLLDPGTEHDGPDALPDVLISLMQDIGIPNGLAAVGYDASDAGVLAEGALQQQRLLAIAPREVDEESLTAILTASLTLW